MKTNVTVRYGTTSTVLKNGNRDKNSHSTFNAGFQNYRLVQDLFILRRSYLTINCIST